MSKQPAVSEIRASKYPMVGRCYEVFLAPGEHLVTSLDEEICSSEAILTNPSGYSVKMVVEIKSIERLKVNGEGEEGE
jgi:hypothetical protein